MVPLACRSAKSPRENWFTHGEQIDKTAGTQCVKQALDLGITTFDTADAYAGTRAEEALGEALNRTRRKSVQVFTKAYFTTGGGSSSTTSKPQESKSTQNCS